MVKKHNTIDKILMLLLSNKPEEFTIRAISKSISVDYKTVYIVVKELITDGILNAKKVGQTVLCSIDRKAFNPDIFRAESLRKERLLRKKDFSIMCDYLDDVKKPFFTLLLFGSYASGNAKKGSDIDLMIITDDEKVKREVKDKISLTPLNIHLVDFNSGEFISMLKTTEFNVGKEASDNNILLFGIEDYYRILQNA